LRHGFRTAVWFITRDVPIWGKKGRQTSNTVCLDFTGDVERIRKWGKGVAVCQALSMDAPKGERMI
jgi:hypothetical protein